MSNSEGKVVIREGFVNAFLIPGVFLVIPAIIFLMTYTPVGVVLSILCIILFAAQSGLEIDPGAKTYRKYHNFFGINIGLRRSWQGYEKALLAISTESQHLQGYMGSPYFFGPLGKTKSLTYNIYLIDGFNTSVGVYDFLTYKNASKALSIFQDLGLEVEDRVMDKIIENRNRRR